MTPDPRTWAGAVGIALVLGAVLAFVAAASGGTVLDWMQALGWTVAYALQARLLGGCHTAWTEGKGRLHIGNEDSFPECCLVCGGPPAGTERVTLGWPKPTEAFVAPSRRLGLMDKETFDVPFCRAHRNHFAYGPTAALFLPAMMLAAVAAFLLIGRAGATLLAFAVCFELLLLGFGVATLVLTTRITCRGVYEQGSMSPPAAYEFDPVAEEAIRRKKAEEG